MSENQIQYRNGDYDVLLDLSNGTKIRKSRTGSFNAHRPESMDVKISNRCGHACPFCHEDSRLDGKVADLDFARIAVSTFPPYTEIAVGGGNLMEDVEHTEAFLKMLVDRRCVPSITLHQKDFIENIEQVKAWRDAGLVYGVGVSLADATDPDLVKSMEQVPSAVLHVIAGLCTESDLDLLGGCGLKVLVLGYKDVRRGAAYHMGSGLESVDSNIEWLADNLEEFMASFAIVAFDNLALDQLPVREVIGEEAFSKMFMGDDGTATFYVDLVEAEFARSSCSEKRHPMIREVDGQQIMATAQGMFRKIKAEVAA